MSQARVYFTPSDIDLAVLKASVGVVIDVLRATTTIVTALANGARQIVPVSSVDKALALKAELAEISPLLCGERNGKKLPQFDLGNSPSEYTRGTVTGRTLIFASTNGSKTILASSKAKKLFIAGFVNLPFAVKSLANTGKNIVIICAGKLDKFGLDDVICAGMMVQTLVSANYELVGDEALAASMLYTANKRDIEGALKKTSHGQYLASLGYEKDIEFASRVGIYKSLPRLEGRRILPY